MQASADFALLREKKAVEASLRAEILVNEEQRSYIEVLREALETKIEDLGFSEGGGKGRVDLFAELANAKRQVDFFRKRHGKLEGTVADNEGTVSSLQQRVFELTQLNKRLELAVEQARLSALESSKGTNTMKATVAKLDEEKNALLDFVEEAV